MQNSNAPKPPSFRLRTLLDKDDEKGGHHCRVSPTHAGLVLASPLLRARGRRPYRRNLRISRGSHVLGGLNMDPSHPPRGPRCSGDSPSALRPHRSAPRRANVCRGAARRRGTRSKNLLREAKFACILSSERRSFFVFEVKKKWAGLKTVSH